MTAQNTAEVRGVVALDPAFVRLQIETVLADLDVRAVKTGMLANEGIVDVVAALAAEGALPHLVVDPVLVSSSGHRLMEDAGVDAYLARLLPHALVATPNLREAAVLGATTVSALAADVAARVEVAEKIRAAGVPWVVVKGGHLTASADDVVAGPTVWSCSRAPGSTRATTTAPAVPSRPPSRPTWPSVSTCCPPCEAAKAFVARALAGGAAWRLGAGPRTPRPFRVVGRALGWRAHVAAGSDTATAVPHRRLLRPPAAGVSRCARP